MIFKKIGKFLESQQEKIGFMLNAGIWKCNDEGLNANILKAYALAERFKAICNKQDLGNVIAGLTAGLNKESVKKISYALDDFLKEFTKGSVIEKSIKDAKTLDAKMQVFIKWIKDMGPMMMESCIFYLMAGVLSGLEGKDKLTLHETLFYILMKKMIDPDDVADAANTATEAASTQPEEIENPDGENKQ